MSGVLRAGAAWAIALALVGALVAGSQVPWVADPSQDALLRLSWRAVGQRVERCREPTPEELAARPAHMRTREICEGRLTPFRLSVRLDGAPLHEGQVRASGAREDRPSYVFHEFRVAPGEHRVEIRFEPELAEGSEPAAGAELALDETVTLEPGSIVLVSRDPSGDRLAILP